MNIFVLDESPVIAAQMLCDKHIVKMPLEAAQLLSNVFSTALKVPNPFVSITDQKFRINLLISLFFMNKAIKRLVDGVRERIM